MDQIEFAKQDETAVGVKWNAAPAGCLKAYVIRPGDIHSTFCFACNVSAVSPAADGARIEWTSEAQGVAAALELTRHPSGFVGAFRGRGTGRAIVRLVWELPVGERGFPFVPAFMYGDNTGGNSPRAMHPQLDNGRNAAREKPWVVDEWLVRTDRSSHGLTSVIGDRLVYAMGGRDVCRRADGSVAEKTGLGISSTDPHRLSFSLGFRNEPFTYSTASGRNQFSRPEGYVDLEQGETEAEFLLFLLGHEGRHAGAAALLREAYGVLHDSVQNPGPFDEYMRDICDALVDRMYVPEVRNFLVMSESRTTEFPRMFDSAWSGGVRTAYPLLVAGHRLKNARWLACARSVISNIAENAVSPASGLFFETYHRDKDQWSARGWWYDLLEQPGHSGYVNGQLCHYLLLASRAEEAAGVAQPGWTKSAAGVLDRVAATQTAEGGFGYTYSEETGAILDGDGFSACWFTPAFVTLHRITGKTRYLDAARRAMDFYRPHVEAFHVYAGPHDIFKAPDEEGILAWIEAARLLHEVTGEERFLSDLVMGLEYELTWRFVYNVVSEVEPLKSLNWCSTGGSVTSACNVHVHPMGSAITRSMLYAAEKTDDPYFRSRLSDALRWTLTTDLHKAGVEGFGGNGMIGERYCHSDSLLTERFPDGSPASVWFCALAWGQGALLEGLVGLDDEDAASLL